MSAETIRQGHIDAASGKLCGWAGAYRECDVPGCSFPSERCVLVQRERDELPEAAHE